MPLTALQQGALRGNYGGGPNPALQYLPQQQEPLTTEALELEAVRRGAEASDPFTRGVGAGVQHGLGAAKTYLGSAIGAMGGDPTGMYRSAEENARRAELLTPAMNRWADVKDVGGAIHYGLGQFGQMLPMVAPAVVGGGIAGALRAGPAMRMAATMAPLHPVMAGGTIERLNADPATANLPPEEKFKIANLEGAAAAGIYSVPLAGMGSRALGLPGMAARGGRPWLIPGKVAAETALGAGAMGAANVGVGELGRAVQREYNPEYMRGEEGPARIEEFASGVAGGGPLAFPHAALAHTVGPVIGGAGRLGRAGADYIREKAPGAAEAAKEGWAKAGEMAGEAWEKTKETAQEMAGKVKEAAPKSMAEASIMAGEAAAAVHGKAEDVLNRILNREKDADIETLLRPQEHMETVEEIDRDDAAKHTAIKNIGKRLPDDAPEFVKQAMEDYFSGPRTMDTWRPVQDAFNKWNRGSTFSDAATRLATRFKVWAGETAAAARGAAEDVGAAYTAKRVEEGRYSAQTPHQDPFDVALGEELARTIDPDVRSSNRALVEQKMPPVVAAMRHWVENGFMVRDGEPYIPEEIIDTFHDSETAVRKTWDMLRHDGHIKGDNVDVLNKVVEELKALEAAKQNAGQLVLDNLLIGAKGKYKINAQDALDIAGEFKKQIASGHINEELATKFFGPNKETVLEGLRRQLPKKEHIFAKEAAQSERTAPARAHEAGEEGTMGYEGSKVRAAEEHGASYEELAGMTFTPLAPNVAKEEVRWHHYNEKTEKPYTVGEMAKTKTGEISHETHAEQKMGDLGTKFSSHVERQGYLDYIRERYGKDPQEVIDRSVDFVNGHMDELTPAEQKNPDAALNKKYFVLRETPKDTGEKLDIPASDFNTVYHDSPDNKWGVNTGSGNKYGVSKYGTIWFRKADGTVFPTSVGKILAHMTRAGKETGFAHTESGLPGLRRMLMQGITSMLNSKTTDAHGNDHFALTAMGFLDKPGGEINWNPEHIPGDLRLRTDGANFKQAQVEKLKMRLDEVKDELKKYLNTAYDEVERAQITEALNSNNVDRMHAVLNKFETREEGRKILAEIENRPKVGSTLKSRTEGKGVEPPSPATRFGTSEGPMEPGATGHRATYKEPDIVHPAPKGKQFSANIGGIEEGRTRVGEQRSPYRTAELKYTDAGELVAANPEYGERLRSAEEVANLEQYGVHTIKNEGRQYTKESPRTHEETIEGKEGELHPRPAKEAPPPKLTRPSVEEAMRVRDKIERGIPATHAALAEMGHRKQARFAEVLQHLLDAKSDDAPIWGNKPPVDRKSFEARARKILSEIGEYPVHAKALDAAHKAIPERLSQHVGQARVVGKEDIGGSRARAHTNGTTSFARESFTTPIRWGYFTQAETNRIVMAHEAGHQMDRANDAIFSKNINTAYKEAEAMFNRPDAPPVLKNWLGMALDPARGRTEERMRRELVAQLVALHDFDPAMTEKYLPKGHDFVERMYDYDAKRIEAEKAESAAAEEAKGAAGKPPPLPARNEPGANGGGRQPDRPAVREGAEKVHKEPAVEKPAGKEAGAKEGVQGRVILPETSPYTAKDQAKSDRATKFIGRGSPRSSTGAYAEVWGDRANTGKYTAEDSVFVSVEGARKGRIPLDTAELQKALDAGATIRTDNAQNRARAYNVGERELASYLGNHGYVESKEGVWTPAPKQAKETRANKQTPLDEDVPYKVSYNESAYPYERGWKITHGETGEGRSLPSPKESEYGVYKTEADAQTAILQYKLSQVAFRSGPKISAEAFRINELLERGAPWEKVKPLVDKLYALREDVNYNKQTAFGEAGAKDLTPEEMTKIKEDIERRLGPDVKTVFEKHMGTMSGDWTEGLIRVSMRAQDPSQVGAHESLHEFFHRLTTSDSKDAQRVKQILLNAANSEPVVRQITRLLHEHPEALAQIKNGATHAAEERLAYMFQFHQAGLLTIGPETMTTFQKIANMFRKVFGLLTDHQKAEKLLQYFEKGKTQTADAAAEVLTRNIESRERMIKSVNKILEPITKRAGRLMGTSTGNLDATGNPILQKISGMFKKRVGEAGEQSNFEAKDHQMKLWGGRLSNIFHGHEVKDLELAAQYLHSGKEPKDPVAKEIVGKVRAMLDNFHDYLKESGVKRWDEKKKDWVDIGHIKNYYPRPYDTNKMIANPEDFIDMLKQYNSKELKDIADSANKDLEQGRELEPGTAAYKAEEEAWKQARKEGIKKPTRADIEARIEPVTEDDVARAITNRLINAFGQPGIEESGSAIGFSPYMQAINKRSLKWIAPEIMAKYGEKDMAKTLTSYIGQGVKRAEYVRLFGNGGEGLRDMMKQARDYEINKAISTQYGVKENADLLDLARQDIANQMAQKKGSVDSIEEALAKQINAYDPKAGATADEVVKLMDQSTMKMRTAAKDVMALEGTLGYDINPKLRRLNNSMMVYQNMRTMGLSLFSQLIDPLGIMVRGGTMKDSWNAYLRGMKEVWASWKGEHTQDEAAKIAEEVGTVDAQGFLAGFGQLYSSMFMGGKFRKANDALFRINGMEGFNRGMQIAGTQAAINFIKAHALRPNKNSLEYLKELNLTPADVKVDQTGNLDYQDPKIQKAIHRWVNGAILRPNAGQRPAWASDPRYMIFWHMKQFAYTFHDTIMKRAMHDVKKYDDLGPAAVLALAYTPMMIAADAAKGLLMSGGQEPAWMKQGLGPMIEHGAMRAGLTGRYQPITDTITNGRSMLSVAGPSVEQLGSLFTQAPSESFMEGLPGASVLHAMKGRPHELLESTVH